jgi:pimeloyl-ACP methyl ester carboxylesterase
MCTCGDVHPPVLAIRDAAVLDRRNSPAVPAMVWTARERLHWLSWFGRSATSGELLIVRGVQQGWQSPGMEESTLVLADGRVVGFATYGPDLGVPVVWCHGGPGSRLEPASFEPFLERLGLRVIGIDRPGYGLSSLRPGRSIANWVPDCLSVADALDVERFIAVGVSTGGAYALAVAAMAPERVRAVVPCCAMSDMRHGPSRETMSKVHCHDLWNAPDRAAAIEVASGAFGDDGGRYMSAADAELCAADVAFLERAATDPAQEVSMRAQFANGVQGYVDDRLADGRVG